MNRGEIPHAIIPYKTYRENIVENKAALKEFKSFSTRAKEFLERVKAAIKSKNPGDAPLSDERLMNLATLGYFQYYPDFTHGSYDRYEYALTHALRSKHISDKLYREGQGLLTTLRSIGSRYFAPIWFNMLKGYNESGKAEIDAIPYITTAQKEMLKKNEFEFMVAIYDVLLGKIEQVRKSHYKFADILEV